MATTCGRAGNSFKPAAYSWARSPRASPGARGGPSRRKRCLGSQSKFPGFSPLLKDEFDLEIPFFLDLEVDPFTGASDPVANPTTIWDFNGFLGLIGADGVSDPDHASDSMARRWECAVRFMTGVFRDRAGRTQQGTFCFL